MAAQTIKGVLGKSDPLHRGIEGIVRIGVAGANGFHPAQRIILTATSPLRAGIKSYLAKSIDNRTVFAQDNGIIAVEVDD